MRTIRAGVAATAFALGSGSVWAQDILNEPPPPAYPGGWTEETFPEPRGEIRGDWYEETVTIVPPARSEDAEKAAKYRERADTLSQQGGVAYKTGLVRDAQAKATVAERAVMADEGLLSPASTTEAMEDAARVHAQGGVAVKTGIAARADEAARGSGAPDPYTTPVSTDAGAPNASKPVQELEQAAKQAEGEPR